MAIRIIATDLDGTLTGYDKHLALLPDLQKRIDRLRATDGTRWIVCTGRSRSRFLNVFYNLWQGGLRPDFVIVRYASVYRVSEMGLWPLVLWNVSAFFHLWLEHMEARYMLRHWRREFAVHDHNATITHETPKRLTVRFGSSEAAEAAYKKVKKWLHGFGQLEAERADDLVEVRSRAFLKGWSLMRLAKHLGVSPEDVLAIGNGFKDVGMVHPAVALMSGCPANSDPEMEEAVHKAGGHIAEAPSLAGVMEILDAHMQGTVSSALPANWKPHPYSRDVDANRPPRDERKRSLVKRLIVLAIVAYTVLTIFANYGMIPMSGLIMKPFRMLVSLLAKLAM